MKNLGKSLLGIFVETTEADKPNITEQIDAKLNSTPNLVPPTFVVAASSLPVIADSNLTKEIMDNALTEGTPYSVFKKTYDKLPYSDESQRIKLTFDLLSTTTKFKPSDVTADLQKIVNGLPGDKVEYDNQLASENDTEVTVKQQKLEALKTTIASTEKQILSLNEALSKAKIDEMNLSTEVAVGSQRMGAKKSKLDTSFTEVSNLLQSELQKLTTFIIN